MRSFEDSNSIGFRTSVPTQSPLSSNLRLFCRNESSSSLFSRCKEDEFGSSVAAFWKYLLLCNFRVTLARVLVAEEDDASDRVLDTSRWREEDVVQGERARKEIDGGLILAWGFERPERALAKYSFWRKRTSLPLRPREWRARFPSVQFILKRADKYASKWTQEISGAEAVILDDKMAVADRTKLGWGEHGKGRRMSKSNGFGAMMLCRQKNHLLSCTHIFQT